MFEKLKALEGNWYGRLSDIVEELEEMGVDTDCCSVCREYIVVSFDEDEEDMEVIIHLGGTENTITVYSVEQSRM